MILTVNPAKKRQNFDFMGLGDGQVSGFQRLTGIEFCRTFRGEGKGFEEKR